MISVIIPFLNRESYLNDTIASLLQQTDSRWECILVDDGSSDNSRAVISKAVIGDTRFKVIDRPDNMLPGGNDARNAGWQAANFPHLIFLDSDDQLAPRCIGERINFLETQGDKDFLVFTTGCFYHRIGDCDKIWNILSTDENDVRRFYAQDPPWLPASVVWRKDFIQKIGGWNASLRCWQDTEIHIRAASLSSNYSKIFGYPDNYYRLAVGDSITSQRETHIYRQKAFEVLLSLEAFHQKSNLPIPKQFYELVIRILIWDSIRFHSIKKSFDFIFGKQRFQTAGRVFLFKTFCLLVCCKGKFFRQVVYKIFGKKFQHYISCHNTVLAYTTDQLGDEFELVPLKKSTLV